MSGILLGWVADTRGSFVAVLFFLIWVKFHDRKFQGLVWLLGMLQKGAPVWVPWLLDQN